MKTFHCNRCGSLLFFENVRCVNCDATLGFLPDHADLVALDGTGEKFWRVVGAGDNSSRYRQCANQAQYQVCNWVVPAEDDSDLCESCRLNETIPDLSAAVNRERWGRLENAKRRLLYTLRYLQLPIASPGKGGKKPLRFRFLADPPGGPRVLTGHSHGVITMNVAEADDAVREQHRVNLHEPYRTPLGHFRHEIAHYYWEQLISDSPRLEPFRRAFGDETRDYAGALRQYYQTGPPPDWSRHYVSAYASSHPWEDWAETWAHYLHVRDSVETAGSFGLKLQPKHPAAAAMTADPPRLADDEQSFDRILRHWLPVTYAVNELNRGMGLPDVYPFVLSQESIQKLRFIHDVVRRRI